MEGDYAGHTIPIIDPSTGEIRAAVLSALQLTFAYASVNQKLPDWIEANQRAVSFFGGVPRPRSTTTSSQRWPGLFCSSRH
ncbi:transposase [Rhizobium sp. BK176]|nr:transposase [Rhizobium sp. BK181]MBB3542874.1 transposase [Rhizobium sp. BK399]MCS3742777.1 transposase [Rhizobium sp. BK661]MCS4095053.1 transposase [Rhizobium sp. BK176]